MFNKLQEIIKTDDESQKTFDAIKEKNKKRKKSIGRMLDD